jgi:hypothetical protein
VANPTQASLDPEGGAHTTLPMNPMYPPPRYFPGSPHAEGAALYESPKAGSVALQRHGFSQEGGSGTPGQNAAQFKRTVQYGNRQPLRKDASWFACCIFLGYLAAVAYYMYVRIAFTLDFKDKWWVGVGGAGSSSSCGRSRWSTVGACRQHTTPASLGTEVWSRGRQAP